MYNFITDNGPDYSCSKCGADTIGEIGHECNTYFDFPCPKCGGDIGHLINCPDGSAFSGDRKTIKNNPLEEEDEM